MRLILLILLFAFSCNDSDDLFFVLNPNKEIVLDKEMKECRQGVTAYFLIATPTVEINNEILCSDSAYLLKNKFLTKEQCLEKLKNDFIFVVLAMYASCPKGLTSLD